MSTKDSNELRPVDFGARSDVLDPLPADRTAWEHWQNWYTRAIAAGVHEDVAAVAYSARPGRPFRYDVGSRSDPPGRSIGAQRRVDGQVDVQLASEPIPFFLRIDGPRNPTT